MQKKLQKSEKNAIILVFDVLSNNIGYFFSITELIKKIKEKETYTLHRITVERALIQLTRTNERIETEIMPEGPKKKPTKKYRYA